METKQFDLIMAKLGDIEQNLAVTNNRITKVEETQNFIKEEIRDFKKEVYKGFKIVEQSNTSLRKSIEISLYDINVRLEDIESDIKILHTLAMVNREEHKEYDKLLNIKRA